MDETRGETFERQQEIQKCSYLCVRAVSDFDREMLVIERRPNCCGGFHSAFSDVMVDTGWPLLPRARHVAPIM